jgi:hypothetical protein
MIGPPERSPENVKRNTASQGKHHAPTSSSVHRSIGFADDIRGQLFLRVLFRSRRLRFFRQIAITVKATLALIALRAWHRVPISGSDGRVWLQTIRDTKNGLMPTAPTDPDTFPPPRSAWHDKKKKRRR